MSLFRREVLASKRQAWLGSVHVAKTSAAWPMALLAGAFLLATIIAISTVSYARSETVEGVLLPEDGLLAIRAAESGIVSRLLVAEGEDVEQGQPMIEISLDRESPALHGGLGASLKSEMQRKKMQITGELFALELAVASGAERLDQRIDTLQRRLALINRQVELREAQLRGNLEVLERVSKLNHGVLTALQVQQYESAATVAEVELAATELQRIDAERDLAEAIDQRGKKPGEIVRQQNELERLLADLGQALARNEAEHAVALHAPRAGTVAAVDIAIGETVGQGRRLFALSPRGAELQAELLVSSRVVGTLRLGQRVALRIDAYPHRKHGHQAGEISAISHAPIEADASATESDRDASRYRVRVRLDRNQAARMAEQTLRPGMSLKADILLDEMPLYQMLLPDLAAGTAKAAPRAAGGQL